MKLGKPLSHARRRGPWADLIRQNDRRSQGQIMWRISMPIAALNLALLAIPLGAVNPASRALHQLSDRLLNCFTVYESFKPDA